MANDISPEKFIVGVDGWKDLIYPPNDHVPVNDRCVFLDLSQFVNLAQNEQIDFTFKTDSAIFLAKYRITMQRIVEYFSLNFDLSFVRSYWWLITCPHLTSSLWKYMYKDILYKDIDVLQHGFIWKNTIFLVSQLQCNRTPKKSIPCYLKSLLAT